MNNLDIEAELKAIAWRAVDNLVDTGLDQATARRLVAEVLVGVAMKYDVA